MTQDTSTHLALCENGEYVRCSPAEVVIKALEAEIDQAGEVIAAKDAEIERLKNLIDGNDCTDPDKIDTLFQRAETAEAKLAQMEKHTQWVLMTCRDKSESLRNRIDIIEDVTDAFLNSEKL